MDNYSYSSYADSRDSSPRSRDENNPSWDEPPSNYNYKVKFMCSYGGKIQPRAHDNQLTYTGGETKILAVDRSTNFSAISSRLSSLCGDGTVCFKYQLPGEDLDALISVTNDEDLEHMMSEYDRLHRVSKPARLRLFLFPLNPPAPTTTSFISRDSKSDRQWFVDALNSVQIQPLEDSSPPGVAPGSAVNPDFLFGFDKGYPPVPGSNLTDSTAVHNVPGKDVTAGTGSDCGSEDRHNIVGESVVSPSEFQIKIQDLQRLHIALTERNSNENNSRTSAADYYSQHFTDQKMAPSPAAAPLPVPLPVPAAYLPERQMISNGYSVSSPANPPSTDQSIYLIPTATGPVYQAQTLRTINGPVGQPYYGMQAHVHTHSSVQQQSSLQQPNIGVYTTEGIQMMQPKVGVTDGGYSQIGYDNSGRQVFFTTAAAPPYQTMAPVAVDGRLSGGNFNQEGNGNVVNNPSKSSGL